VLEVGDEVGLAHRRHHHVGLTGQLVQVHRLLVAQGDGGVAVEQHVEQG